MACLFFPADTLEMWGWGEGLYWTYCRKANVGGKYGWRGKAVFPDPRKSFWDFEILNLCHRLSLTKYPPLCADKF